MNKFKITKEKGAVTLIAVLIIGLTVSSIIIVSSLYSRISILNTRIFKNHEENMYFAEACAEKALFVLHGNNSYTGSDSFSDGDYDCDYEAINNGSNSRLIQASSTVNDLNYLVEVDISITSTNIEIDYWNRVTSF